MVGFKCPKLDIRTVRKFKGEDFNCNTYWQAVSNIEFLDTKLCVSLRISVFRILGIQLISIGSVRGKYLTSISSCHFQFLQVGVCHEPRNPNNSLPKSLLLWHVDIQVPAL